MTNRRKFITQLGLGSAAMLAGHALAAPETVSEADPQASSMGYKASAAKVDKAKFPKYAPPQQCSNCVLFQGKATDATGPCSLFGGKLVSGPGWCNAYTKKA